MRDSYRTIRIAMAVSAWLLAIGIAGCGDDDKPNNSDTTPPTVTSTTPADDATLVSLSSNLTAEFSEDMDSTTINSSTFTLMQGANPVAGTVSYSSNPGATFNPDADLLPETEYTATITTGAEDLAGNGLENDHVWTFTTGPAPDVTPPTVTVTVPADNAVNVSVNAVITATFSEPLSPATVTAGSFLVLRGISPVAGVVTYSGNTATFTPDDELLTNTEYTATITVGVTDLAGNHLAAEHVWTFTTEAGADVTPPTVLSTVPANLATNVSVSANITASFSEAMNAATITAASFTLTQGVNPVAGAVSYSGTTATFNPNADLSFNTLYTATITVAATDVAGNALTVPVVWTFTTAAAPDVTPPTVIAVAPASGAVDVVVGTNVTATFSEAMNPASITTDNFMLMQGAVHINGSISYAGNTLTFNPTVDLEGGALFTATVFTGVEDVAGNNLAADFIWSFTTEIPPDVTPPTVVSTVPANGALGIAIGGNITATFSEAMSAASITTATFTLSKGVTPVAGVVTYSGGTATFNPDTDLDSSTVYTATITTGVEDEAGNNLAANFVWTFTTGDPGDVTAPTVTVVSPLNLSTNISTITNITATFSEPMDPATINTTTFVVTSGVTPVPGVVTYSGMTATFNPSVTLDTIKLYSARITTGATDLAGNPLAADFAWVFTTERSPAVTATVPASGAPNVPITAKVSAQFTKAMGAASFTSSTFTVREGGNDVAGTISVSGPNAVFDPSSNLLPNTVYTVTLTTGVTDTSGNRMTANHSWTFTTGTTTDVTPPTITATDPADAATGVDDDKQIRAFFSEAMDLSTLNTTTFTVSTGGNNHPGTVEYSGTIVTFKPTAGQFYQRNTVYTARITTAATDISGNAIADEKVWTFTIEP